MKDHYSLDLDLRISEAVLLEEDCEFPEFDTYTRPEELLHFLPMGAQQSRRSDTYE